MGSNKLKADDEQVEEEEDSEEEVDDDAEAENLLSEGDSSDSDGELIMKNVADEGEDDEEGTPVKMKKSKKLDKAGKISSASKKSKKDKKFVDKKKVKGSK